jgi:hypothetical protein
MLRAQLALQAVQPRVDGDVGHVARLLRIPQQVEVVEVKQVQVFTAQLVRPPAGKAVCLKFSL